MKTVDGKIARGTKCPVMGGKSCMQFECVWWMSIKGADPQTGEPVEEWNCAVVYQVVASLETAQQSRQTGAAVESFRNEMVRQQGALAMLLAGAMEDANGVPRLESKKDDAAPPVSETVLL